MPPRPHLALPSPATRRAVVVGAGSFGTAVAVLLARGGFRTTLQTRTREQAGALDGRPRERGLPARASSCRASCAIEPAARASAAPTTCSSASPRAGSTR